MSCQAAICAKVENQDVRLPADIARRATNAVLDARVITALRPRSWLLALVILLTLQGSRAAAQSSDREIVDLELALLVDVSASVSDEEFRLQAKGFGVAFTSQSVLEAIDRFTPRGMAVCVVQWSDHAHQRLAVSWTLLRDRGDAIRFAEAIAAMPRLFNHGHTAIGDALIFGLRELETNRYSGRRRVIDLSGDGRANDGQPLRLAREAAIGKGVTINGLAILNELPFLDRYFRKYLIAGNDAFAMIAQDYSDFAGAMSRKLLREIRSIPLARNGPPARQITASQ